jgi:GNAT superfamily N-acetyltransferase
MQLRDYPDRPARWLPVIRHLSFWELGKVDRSFALTFPTVTRAERTHALAHSRAVYVAHRRCQILGFYVANYREDRRSLWLDYLGVGPPFQRRGVGRALIRHCCDLGRTHAVSKLELCVWSSNAAALRLYQREGFTKIEESVEPRSGEVKCILDKSLTMSDPAAPSAPTSLVPYSMRTLTGALHILGWRTALCIPRPVFGPRPQRKRSP